MKLPLGMANPEIRIEEYSADWPQIFLQLRSVYETFLGDRIKAVHHVGSTSVPGLAAKPVIDLDIEIETQSLFLPVKETLEKLGYVFIGNLGIKDRFAFRQSSDATPLDNSGRAWHRHNLYVCQTGNVALQNHLLFRDYLRTNPGKMKIYEALKKELAQRCTEMDEYTEGKTAFIVAALREQGFDESILAGITEQNKAKQ